MNSWLICVREDIMCRVSQETRVRFLVFIWLMLRKKYSVKKIIKLSCYLVILLLIDTRMYPSANGLTSSFLPIFGSWLFCHFRLVKSNILPGDTMLSIHILKWNLKVILYTSCMLRAWIKWCNHKIYTSITVSPQISIKKTADSQIYSELGIYSRDIEDTINQW